MYCFKKSSLELSSLTAVRQPKVPTSVKMGFCCQHQHISKKPIIDLKEVVVNYFLYCYVWFGGL